MAEYRQIHTQIWRDEWFLDLPPEGKLLFIYLFSNSSTNIPGIYKISPRVIAFETGMQPDIIDLYMQKFQEAGKVYSEDGYIWVVNMHKYNANRSPKVAIRIELELKEIPDLDIKKRYIAKNIPYRYPIDRDTPIQDKTIHNNTNHNNINKPVATFSKFQNEIAMLTPKTSDMAQGWIDEYTDEWVCDAIDEAVRQNVRKPAYIDAILKRWKNEGRSSGPNGAKPVKPAQSLEDQGYHRIGSDK